MSLSLKKVKCDFWGKRGRLINIEDRRIIVDLIKETNNNGARLIPVCETVGISKRTYERWCKGGEILEDKRKTAIRPEPKNKLSKEEYQNVLNVVNHPQFADLPPSQIVPALADKGIYSF